MTQPSNADPDKDLVAEGPSGPLALAALIFGIAAMYLFFRNGITGGVDATHPPSIWAVNISFCAMIAGAVAIYRVRRMTKQGLVRLAAAAGLVIGLVGVAVFFWQGMNWRTSFEGRELRQLSRIAQAARDYARDHDGQFPDDLVALLTTYRAAGEPPLLSPEDLISPMRATRPLDIPVAELLKKMPRDQVERAVMDHSDYMYLARGIRGLPRKADNSWDLSSKLIVAASKEFGLRGHERVTVAFASGDAKYVKLQELAETLRASNEERKKLNLPPIDESGQVKMVAPASATAPAATAASPSQ